MAFAEDVIPPGEDRLIQTDAFVAQVLGAVIALLIVLIPILWRLRAPIERIIQRLEAQSTQTVEAATSTASQIGEVSRLIALSQQQLAVQQASQGYMIDANTSLREDRDEQRRRYENVQAQFNDVNNRMRTYSDNLGIVTAALEKSEAARSEQDKRVGELTQKVDILTSASIDNTKTLAATQAELELTRRELEKTKVSLASALKRVDELEREQKEAAHEKAVLQKERDDAHAEVSQLKGEVEALKARVLDLQSQLNAQKPATLPEQADGTQKLGDTLPSADPDPTQKKPGLFTVTP